MRCKNQGSEYDDQDIQWTCTAPLPSDFKLGSTDVVCEGYESSSDPYVLKGSCGVEYRLILTDVGEEKYGKKGRNRVYDDDMDDSGGSKLASVLFGIVFIGVLGWIVYSAFFGARNANGNNRGPGFPVGWGGGGGGGFGGDDPPPPYSRQPPPSGRKSHPSGWAADASSRRPGFWTGAAAGAAGTYLASNRGQTPSWGRSDNGEGSSTGQTRSSSSSSPSFSSTRYQSSGFGSTSRR
ncbi:MAG: hypothetical protein Q9170_000251 [Blastenia crenularia]